MEPSITFTIIWIALRIASAKGGVSVHCGFRSIKVKIEDHSSLSQKLDAVFFFAGSASHESSNICRADVHGEMGFSFPFQTCGVRAELFGDGAVYTSTVWVVTSNGTVFRYADVKCKYGTRFGDAREPKNINLQRLTDGNHMLNVSLCSTPFYCPSQICPPEKSFRDHVISFERDVLTLAINFKGQRTPENGQVKVAAINHLMVKCGTDPEHPMRIFYSVEDGCKSKRSYISSSRDRKPTLRTDVNYNVQSDTVCMSVDMPLSKDCSRLHIYGTMINCDRAYEEKCEDYSGSKCISLDAEKFDFVYGPIYILPRHASMSEVKCYVSDPCTTTPQPETTPFVEEYSDVDDNFQGLEMNDLETIGLELGAKTVREKTRKMDEISKVQSDRVAGRNFAGETKIQNGKEPKNSLFLKEHVIPEDILRFIEEDAFRDEISEQPKQPLETDKDSPVQSFGFSNANGADTVQGTTSKDQALLFTTAIASSIASPGLRNVKLQSVTKFQNDVTRNPKLTKNGPEIASDSSVSGDFIPNEESFALEEELSTSPEERRKIHSPGKNETIQDVRKPREAMFLGKFNAAGAGQGFIWASVSALGLFLLISIGLLVAWIATKRKKARRE